MKFFKKIILPVIAGVCVLMSFAAFAACDDGGETSSGSDDKSTANSEDSTSVYDDSSLTDTQFVVYVYLDDGTTPVEGITFQLCYNTNDTQSTCSGTIYETDSNGRVLFDMTDVTYVDDPVIHIAYVLDLTAPDENGEYTTKIYSSIPDGYGLPADGTTQYLNGNASYEDAWALTQRVTTLTLTKTEA